MVIGVLTIEVSIDGAFSLKEKRVTVNRIRDRVRRKFNVAVAEVGDNDVWNHACIGVAAVSNQQKHANQILSRVIEFVKTIRDCEVEDFSMEFL